MAEQWLPIEGYENYMVSNLGNVKNVKKNRILKKGDRNGYLRVTLTRDGKKKLATLSRLVAIAFIPNTGNKKEVNHINGDKYNNSVYNLEWVTPHENIIHAWNNGLSKPRKMSECHKRKLKDTNAKKVINVNKGIIYDSITEAAKSEGYKKSTLIHYLIGSRKNKTSLEYV